MEAQDITGLLAIVIAVLSLLISYRKAPHEEHNLDAESAKSTAETAKTFEETAALAGERANRLEREIAQLRIELSSAIKTISDQGKLIDTLVGKDKDKEARIQCLEEENKSLIEWISRLVLQIKSLGGIPVQFKEERK